MRWPPLYVFAVPYEKQQHLGVAGMGVTTSPQTTLTAGPGTGLRPHTMASAYTSQLTPTVTESMGREGVTTSVEMTVPDRAVRFCIGKQGSAITVIQKQSKAHFEFAKVRRRENEVVDRHADVSEGDKLSAK